MSDFWRWILGLKDLTVPEGGSARLELAGLPQSVAALGSLALLLGALGAVFWIYRREGDLPMWKKMSLAAVRCLVVLTIAGVLVEPNLVYDLEKSVEATTILLVDDSQSMTIRDRYQAAEGDLVKGLTGDEEIGEGIARSSVASAILRNARLDIPARLAGKNRLRAYAFSDRLTPIEMDGLRPSGSPPPDGGDAPPDAPGADADVDVAPPRGQSTNLSRGLREALGLAGGQTIAGVVIISDGRVNEGEPLSIVSKTLLARGAPAHVVGVGDPRPPKNIQVESLLAPERVFAKDPVVFEIRVGSAGLDGATVVGELSAAEEGGEGPVVLETVELELTGGEQSLTLQARPEKPGRFLYSFRIEPQEGEIIPEDNARSIPITVVDDLIHVLLVSGGPSHEYRFLKNLLLRDPTVELSAWLQSADVDFLQEGNKRIDRLPGKGEEFRQYDVIILLDPNPVEVDNAWVRELGSFVNDHGGGLFFMAGPKHTLRLLRDPKSRDLTDLLPVEIDTATAERGAGVGKVWSESWPLGVTAQGLEHPVGRLGGDPRTSEAIWKALPGIHWHLPVDDVKPGGTVLLRHTDPRERTNDGLRPILAVQYVGAGRVVFSATDEFHAWRGVAEEVYNRFWMQNIRYLVGGRLLGGKRRVTILLDKEEFSLGEPIELTVRLLDRNYVPVETEEVAGQLRPQSGLETEFVLRPIPNRKGEYGGTVIPRAAGTYELRVGDEMGETGTATVQVELPNLEFEDPRMDEALLRELAETTGGRFYALDEIPTLPDDIPDRRETVIISSAPVALWDAPLVLALLAGLLIVEWFVRKRSQLA